MLNELVKPLYGLYHDHPMVFWCIVGLFLPLPLMVICWIKGWMLLIHSKGLAWIKKHPLILLFTGYTILLSWYNHSLIGSLLALGIGVFSLWIIPLIDDIHHDIHGKTILIDSIAILSLIPALYSILQVPVIERAIFIWLDHTFSIGFNLDYTPLDRYMGTFFHPNYYAYICVLVILALMVRCLFMETSKKQYGLTIVFILINLVMLYQTGSRTGLLMGLVAISILLIIKWPWMWIPLGLIILIFLVQPSLILDIIPRMDNVFYAINDRYQLWSEGFHNFLTHPWFGQGYFTLANRWYLFGSNYNVHAHSLIIECFEAFGIMGTSFLVITITRYLYGRIKQNKTFPILMGITILFVLLSGLIDVSILLPQTYILTILLLLL